MARQCELIGLPRSTYSYQPIGEWSLNIELMHLIDEEYTRHPYYGSRRIRACLHRQGYRVNRKRIQRLMRCMGIVAIYPKPRLSQATYEKLRAVFPPWDISVNPFDMGVSMQFYNTTHIYEILLDALAEDPNVDCLAMQIGSLHPIDVDYLVKIFSDFLMII